VERLVQKKLEGPAEEQLADLIRAAAPLTVSPARKREGLASVLAQRDRRTRGSLILRPVIVVAALLITGATAAATLGHTWIAERVRALVVTDRVASAPPAHVRRRADAAPKAEVTAPPVIEPVAVTPPAPAPRVRPSARLNARARASDHLRASPHDDPSHLVQAIRALRTDHDPQRASRLLAEYLRIYPRGALAEEAIALSIEAAAARNSPSAVSFAQLYLSKYPSGRFRRAAEQALQRK
jgi:hypothetical protein